MSEKDVGATYRVRIWRGRYDEYPDEPDETVEIPENTVHVWQNDPHFHQAVALDLHPEDTPATLNVYTSESVRSPPGYDSHVELGYWDGPIERGLTFDSARYDEYPPFGCEVGGRVMFYVEEGGSR